MYGCESWTIKKGLVPKTWYFQIVVWRRLSRACWITRKSNQSILKEINPEYSLEGLMLNLESPVTWLGDVKSQLIWKDPDTGKEWGQEKGMTENEMVGWHHRLNGHEFGWNLGVGDGQGGLVCCGTWGHKESDTTEWLNWTELNWRDINIKKWIGQIKSKVYNIHY